MWGCECTFSTWTTDLKAHKGLESTRGGFSCLVSILQQNVIRVHCLELLCLAPQFYWIFKLAQVTSQPGALNKSTFSRGNRKHADIVDKLKMRRLSLTLMLLHVKALTTMLACTALSLTPSCTTAGVYPCIRKASVHQPIGCELESCLGNAKAPRLCLWGALIVHAFFFSFWWNKIKGTVEP